MSIEGCWQRRKRSRGKDKRSSWVKDWGGFGERQSGHGWLVWIVLTGRQPLPGCLGASTLSLWGQSRDQSQQHNCDLGVRGWKWGYDEGIPQCYSVKWLQGCWRDSETALSFDTETWGQASRSFYCIFFNLQQWRICLHKCFIILGAFYSFIIEYSSW